MHVGGFAPAYCHHSRTFSDSPELASDACDESRYFWPPLDIGTSRGFVALIFKRLGSSFGLLGDDDYDNWKCNLCFRDFLFGSIVLCRAGRLHLCPD
jgi:hypothetical protein